MIRYKEIFLFFLYLPLSLMAQPVFNDYFTDNTMRIDYYHIGNAENEIITIDQIYKYGKWAGSRKSLLDEFDNGNYYAKIYDLKSLKLIFSKGYDSYFAEYQTSSEALNRINRTYHESILIPYPVEKIKLVIEKRNRNNQLEEVFSADIDPHDIMIIRDKISDPAVMIFEKFRSGNPHSKVDIVILGEGYTTDEVDKFTGDLQKFTEVFFKYEPYTSYKNYFNIYGILKPSEESGIDEPRAAIYKNTVLNLTFNSLGSERYILTEDNKAIRNLAAHVPYDAICIMVNHKRYGGGGIYNLYCTFTSDNQWQDYLFIHEFGHSFSGLADEYYTSETAYTDFYPPGVEPSAPNITALIDPNNIKWNDLLSTGVSLPTLWEKEGYEQLDYPWQKERRQLNNQIAELKKQKAKPAEILKVENLYASKDKAHSEKVNIYLKKSKYTNKVGAFEGAGYASTGIYRPMINCIMFSKTTDFCNVCENAIIEVIKHYSE
jgi:hypothetical protein